MNNIETLNSIVVDYLNHISGKECSVTEIVDFIRLVEGCGHAVCYNMEKDEIQGLFWKDNDYIQLTRNSEEISIILVNNETKRMQQFKGIEEMTIEEQDITQVKENYILNFSFDGRRWEGPILNEMQFGFGVEFDSNGLCCYEGFSYGMNRVCYGIEYNNIEMKEYEGGLVNGKRFGHGEIFNRRNELEYSGMLLMGSPLGTNSVYPIIHSHLDEIIWPTLTEVIQTIRICNIPTIMKINLVDSTFCNLRVFYVENMPNTLSINIGDKCSTTSSGDSFIIKKCRRLESIHVGSSFTKCDFVEISECANIARITMKKQAFMICHKILFESR